MKKVEHALLSIVAVTTNERDFAVVFKRDFEIDHSKLRILVDSRLENQRIWRFVLISTRIKIMNECGHFLLMSLSLSTETVTSIGNVEHHSWSIRGDILFWWNVRIFTRVGDIDLSLVMEWRKNVIFVPYIFFRVFLEECAAVHKEEN